MTMTVGARSLDNEERSNFRDYMSLLSLSVDASMTVREVMAVAYLIGDPAVRGARGGLFRPAAAVPASGRRHRASRGPSAGLPRAINGGGPMMHLILVIAVVIILAASYLLTFALCRAATRRDMLEARWREESAGSVSEESHESA